MNSLIHGQISEENIQFYHEYGYLVAPNLIPQNGIDELRNEAIRIVKGECGDIEGLLETEKADSDLEILNRYAAIHFPHKISNIMKKYAGTAEVSEVLARIISPNVKCLQTMLFIKAPGKKGQAWHQDEYFIPTRDRSLTGAWIALDDADEDNGCLWIIPGSHKDGYIRKRVTNHVSSYADVDITDISPYTEERLC